jgi:septum site-determining protein MinD
MAKVYVITSGKGGVGKTTTAVNLGAALNKFKEDVLIVDANLSTPNLGLHFGAPIVPVSLSHVLQGKAEIEDAIYEHSSGLKLVPSSLSLKDMQKIDFSMMEGVSKKLKKLSTHIIFDSAAGLGEEAKTALENADEIILVTNPNILSVTDSLKAVKLAQDLNKTIRGVIITKVKGEKTEMPLENIKDMLEVPVLGIVPDDSAVEESLVKKNAVINTKPRSKSAKAYMDIAAKILGKKRKPESMLDKLLGSLGI